ncbi:methyltransferase domain-containing protein [Paenibacillus glycinis]|uniref:Methyltransferase domain-containing protein n=1 Tax=Paenibacillus glycinis TaxID=2697035 RepID=A0ABW9XZQ5_9BACL|nr:methyltransferase domain-containing protein [Paenibacillus glycinis]NBD28200.1 methyltransferase domain-containing protein [Paenibacillus glycinis]
MDPNNEKMRAFILDQIVMKPQIAILDLGCGHGYDLFQLSRSADADSRFVGLDTMDEAIQKATGQYGGDARLRFVRHDIAQGLPFPDGSFDAVYSNNMLECITDKQALLREAHRVLKPGGQAVFAHFDWDSQSVDGDNKDLIRMITHAYNEWKQDWMTDIDSWMGRRLWRTFQQSGLFTGRIETFVLTNTRFEAPYYGHAMIVDFAALARRKMIRTEAYEELLANLTALHDRDQFFYSITMYVYVGNKSPAS